MVSPSIDRDFLERFEATLDLRRPEQGEVPAEVLGYGEISTVLAIGSEPFAFKRMPMFLDGDEADAYERLHADYVALLEDAIGMRIVPSRTVRLGRHHGKIVIYIVQDR